MVYQQKGRVVLVQAIPASFARLLVLLLGIDAPFSPLIAQEKGKRSRPKVARATPRSGSSAKRNATATAAPCTVFGKTESISRRGAPAFSCASPRRLSTALASPRVVSADAGHRGPRAPKAETEWTQRESVHRICVFAQMLSLNHASLARVPHKSCVVLWVLTEKHRRTHMLKMLRKLPASLVAADSVCDTDSPQISLVSL
jgi:hypothetical protein